MDSQSDMRSNRRQGQTRDAYISFAWSSGVPLDEMCSELGLSKSRVSTLAKCLGLPSRRPRATEREVARFIELYQRGLTVGETARRTGWHRDTVTQALIGAGIEIRRRRWPVNHHAFSPPLSSEAWYWIGFLAADGFIKGTAVILNLKDSSEAALRRFLEFVGSRWRPLIVCSNRAKSARAYSAQLVSDLAVHGVVANKTLTLRVSEEAASQAAFWLGEFDGDGSVWVPKDRPPKLFFVGTHALMTQCSSWIQAIIGARPGVHRWVKERE
jgi:hypothetical protein